MTMKFHCHQNWLAMLVTRHAIFVLSLCLSSIGLTTGSQYNIYFTTTTSNINNNNLGGDLDLFKITWEGSLSGSSDRDSVDPIYDAIIERDVLSLFNSEDNDNVVNIATKYNERYMCLIPDHNKDRLNFDTSAKNSSSTEKTKSPIELLKPLLSGGIHCSYKFDLFWTYELCHGKFLRQYHEENGRSKSKVTQEFYLGRMDQEQIKLQEEEYEKQMEELDRTGQPRPTILINGHYKPYVMFNMTSGTECDLTKNDRVSRIIYVCNEELGTELYSIKEISTCEYEAIVLSPHLCQHKDFKVGTTTQHEIKCYSLAGSPRKPKFVHQFGSA